MKDELLNSELVKIVLDKLMKAYDGDHDEFMAIMYLFEKYDTERICERKTEELK
ncbi:MAG: hypothetical protein ACI4JB_07470 [Porcipelethomonas sp.]